MPVVTQALSMTHLSASGGRPNQRDFILLTFRSSLGLVDHLHFERLVLKVLLEHLVQCWTSTYSGYVYRTPCNILTSNSIHCTGVKAFSPDDSPLLPLRSAKTSGFRRIFSGSSMTPLTPRWVLWSGKFIRWAREAFLLFRNTVKCGCVWPQ